MYYLNIKNLFTKNVVIFSSVLFVVLVIIFGQKYILKQNASKSQSQSGNVTTDKSTQNTEADWKTYKNTDYSFQLDYPARFDVAEISKRENFYDTFAAFMSGSSKDEAINLKAIHDVDIYKSQSPEKVAEREVMDSELKYTISKTSVGAYLGAIASSNVTYPVKKTIIVTVAHPTKNLFIEMRIYTELSKVEFEKMFSSFRFTADTSSIPSDWTVHENKTYNFSIKFPRNYEVQPGNEEQNTCIRLNADSPCEVLINIYPNKDNLSLEDYLSKKSTAFSITGPLIPYIFNGYETLFNKNQPGTNLFIKRGLTVFRFIASKASSDKEIGDIVASFKFTQ